MNEEERCGVTQLKTLKPTSTNKTPLISTTDGTLTSLRNYRSGCPWWVSPPATLIGFDSEIKVKELLLYAAG